MITGLKKVDEELTKELEKWSKMISESDGVTVSNSADKDDILLNLDEAS